MDDVWMMHPRTRAEWHGGWSRARREVYGERPGTIFIWDWTSGALKKRVRYPIGTRQDRIFSPDGKWLILTETLTSGSFLRRYDVQTGKMVEVINQYPSFGPFGFSPDGRFFWFVQKGGSLNVLRADTWKWVTGANCAGPVKWVASNRVGIVQEKGFEWLDVKDSGYVHNRRRLPGPAAGVSDWALSPDGQSIYAAELSGVIRKWRRG